MSGRLCPTSYHLQTPSGVKHRYGIKLANNRYWNTLLLICIYNKQFFVVRNEICLIREVRIEFNSVYSACHLKILGEWKKLTKTFYYRKWVIFPNESVTIVWPNNMLIGEHRHDQIFPEKGKARDTWYLQGSLAVIWTNNKNSTIIHHPWIYDINILGSCLDAKLIFSKCKEQQFIICTSDSLKRWSIEDPNAKMM